MAYVTGTANSLTDLLTAIQNACTGNGWTLSAGGVLSKGTCFAELKISGTYITVRGGTGVDGSGNLTGACDTTTGRLNSIAGNWHGTVPAAPAFSFPMTYAVHIQTAPDEVYCVVNYAASFYELIAFGQSSMPGLTGSGNWYCGNVPDNLYYVPWLSGGEGASSGACYSLFARDQNNRGCGVHHALDSATWAVKGSATDASSLFLREPNQWNQESILIPIRVYAGRPSGFISPVLECAHARFVNIANLSDQQIITLGSDKWKVYPWWSRGTPNIGGYNVGAPLTYTGVCGHAIRYDGP